MDAIDHGASTAPPARVGGRGARQRILETACELFYREGINATGIERLAEQAHVSKRTLYQHFSSKDDLVAAYLARMGAAGGVPPDRVLRRADRPARERLLAVFDVPAGFRGCPNLNAAAELCDADHPARQVARENKQAFIDLLITVAGEAGARNPEQLGHQLAVLADGVNGQCVTLGSLEPARHARHAAELLIDISLA